MSLEHAPGRRKRRGRKTPQVLPVDPCALSYRLQDAIRYSGLSRSGIYVRLFDGTLVARKAGKSLLIDGESLRRCVENLPVAQFRHRKKSV